MKPTYFSNLILQTCCNIVVLAPFYKFNSKHFSNMFVSIISFDSACDRNAVQNPLPAGTQHSSRLAYARCLFVGFFDSLGLYRESWFTWLRKQAAPDSPREAVRITQG